MTASEIPTCRCTGTELESDGTCHTPDCPNLPMENRMTLLAERHPDADLYVEELFGENGVVLEQYIVDVNTDTELAKEDRPELMIGNQRTRTNFERTWNV